MKISRQVGTTSELLNIYIQDATVSTGAGLANIIGSTLNYSFIRNNQAAFSSNVASTATTTGAWSSSALIQVHSSQAKGMYQFGLPDAALASGDSVLILLYGTTGVAASMAPLPIEIELTKTNNQQYASSTVFSSTNIVQTVTGLVGVSTITLSAASTISQGVNATTGTLSVGLVGVSTITASAASTITQGVNTTTQTALCGVSTLTASSIKFASVDPGAWPLWGIIDSGQSQSTNANQITLRSAFSGSTSVLNGATVFIYGSTSDIWDRRIVTSFSGATDIVGVDAWTQTPDSTVSYIVFATPPASLGTPPAVNLTQIYGQPAVTTSAGTLGVANAGLVGVSTITLSAASTITQGVNSTTNSGLAGVSTITLSAASTISQGVNATTGTLSVGLVGVSTITLSAASTITQGVNATTGTLSVGLVGVSTITLAAASTITQGVNVTSGGLSGLVGVSSITLSAASTITQGVNATSGGISGSVSVSSITLSAASTITQGVNVTGMAAAVQAAIAAVVLSTTQPESYRTVNATGSLIQLMYEAVAHLGDFANVGTTKTLHSITSHAGSVATFGYDSTSTPSSITRVS